MQVRRCQLDADSQRAPRAALRFRVPVEFAKASADEDGETPITMLARSSQPIEHWYWGKVAHDLDGMQLRKESLPLDYCHDPYQIVGVASQFDVKEDGLHVSGKLVSAFASDRVAEITKLAAKGVPYEASIDFYGPMKLERVYEDQVAEVNGQQFEGPGIIVRRWTLNAVAVCPLGADPNTRSQFAAGEPDEVEISFSDEDTAMGVKNANGNGDPKDTNAPAGDAQLSGQQPNPPAAAQPSEADAAKLAEAAAAAFGAKLNKFVAEFGSENGSKWAAEGKSYEEALKLHAADLAAKLAAQGEAKDKEIDELKTKLAAVDTGEETPVEFSDGGDEKNAAKAKLSAKIGDNLAAFASRLKMPSAN